LSHVVLHIRPWHQKALHSKLPGDYTDDGLLAFATEKVKVDEIDVRGVESLTLVAATRLIFECEARLVLPIKLDQLVQKLCVGLDPQTVLQTALGKALLFLEAQPSATNSVHSTI
jgi:hypothetical protein